MLVDALDPNHDPVTLNFTFKTFCLKESCLFIIEQFIIAKCIYYFLIYVVYNIVVVIAVDSKYWQT